MLPPIYGNPLEGQRQDERFNQLYILFWRTHTKTISICRQDRVYLENDPVFHCRIFPPPVPVALANRWLCPRSKLHFRERKTSLKGWRFMTSLMIGNRIPSFILIWETAKRNTRKVETLLCTYSRKSMCGASGQSKFNRMYFLPRLKTSSISWWETGCGNSVW